MLSSEDTSCSLSAKPAESKAFERPEMDRSETFAHALEVVYAAILAEEEAEEASRHAAKLMKQANRASVKARYMLNAAKRFSNEAVLVATTDLKSCCLDSFVDAFISRPGCSRKMTIASFCEFLHKHKSGVLPSLCDAQRPSVESDSEEFLDSKTDLILPVSPRTTKIQVWSLPSMANPSTPRYRTELFAAIPETADLGSGKESVSNWCNPLMKSPREATKTKKRQCQHEVIEDISVQESDGEETSLLGEKAGFSASPKIKAFESLLPFENCAQEFVSKNAFMPLTDDAMISSPDITRSESTQTTAEILLPDVKVDNITPLTPASEPNFHFMATTPTPRSVASFAFSAQVPVKKPNPVPKFSPVMNLFSSVNSTVTDLTEKDPFSSVSSKSILSSKSPPVSKGSCLTTNYPDPTSLNAKTSVIPSVSREIVVYSNYLKKKLQQMRTETGNNEDSKMAEDASVISKADYFTLCSTCECQKKTKPLIAVQGNEEAKVVGVVGSTPPQLSPKKTILKAVCQTLADGSCRSPAISPRRPILSTLYMIERESIQVLADDQYPSDRSHFRVRVKEDSSLPTNLP